MPDIFLEIKGLVLSFVSEALTHANEAVEQSLNTLMTHLQRLGCTVMEIVHTTVSDLTEMNADAPFLSMDLQLLRGMCNAFSYGDVALDPVFRHLLSQWMGSLQSATLFPVDSPSPAHL